MMLDPVISESLFSIRSRQSVASFSAIAFQSSTSVVANNPAVDAAAAPIAAIAGASSVVIVIIIIALVLLIRKRRRSNQSKSRYEEVELTSSAHGVSPLINEPSPNHDASADDQLPSILDSNAPNAVADKLENSEPEPHPYTVLGESSASSMKTTPLLYSDGNAGNRYDNDLFKEYEEIGTKEEVFYDNAVSDKANEGSQKARSDIKVVKEIGSGQFGVVSQATVPRWWLLGTKTSTAKQQQSGQLSDACVKMLRSDADRKSIRDFDDEAVMMEKFSHPNVVRVLASFINEDPHILVLEYMPYGDLKSLMRKAYEQKVEITFKEQLQIFSQVATGMAYLSSLRFIHRDLAARNCLVGESLTVKIADFGLSRALEDESEYYKIQTKGKLPAKWMAPESLNFRRFTTFSDVWSFGVLMWEVQHYGAHPYSDLEGKDLSGWLEHGNRLPRAASCTDEIHQLMSQIWSWEPLDRPSFEEIQLTLTDIMRQSAETSVRDLGKILYTQ